MAKLTVPSLMLTLAAVLPALATPVPAASLNHSLGQSGAGDIQMRGGVDATTWTPGSMKGMRLLGTVPTVPEPGTLGVLGAGALLLLRRKRRG